MGSVADRFRLAGAALLMGALGVAAFGQELTPPVVTIDDRAIQGRFQEELEALMADSSVPRAQTLAVGLKKGALGKDDPAVKPIAGGKSELTSPAIYDRACRGTLIVGHLYQCGKCTKWHPSVAGGVVIDPQGILVTNFHVMKAEKAEIFGAMNADGEVFPVVEILAASEEDDLAIVRVRTGDRPMEAISLSAGEEPVGGEVRVISHPDGRFFTFSEGVIARYYFDPSARAPRVQITADYARGSSGCGVFDTRGGLVGIVSSTNSIYYTETKEDQRNLQMVVKSCIPVSSIRKLLGQ